MRMYILILLLSFGTWVLMSLQLLKSEYALKNKRAICTFNIKDFVQLYNRYYKENKHHAGIIVSSQINLPETLRRLVKFLNNTTLETIENSIEFLNNWKWLKMDLSVTNFLPLFYGL